MKKLAITIIVLASLAIFGITLLSTNKKSPAPIACTAEAKVCPDGSAVGRVGSTCEFAPCPSAPAPTSTTGVISTKPLYKSFRPGGVGPSVTPLEVVQDSRCPMDVVCIQAGTVQLKVRLASVGGIEDATLTLGVPIEFMGRQIELIGVQPPKKSGQTIAPQDYSFDFTMTPVTSISVGVLKGTMTIGPICPVERPGHPCKPTPEMFAARKIFVYAADRTTLVTTLTPDSQGNFSANLLAGSYFVDTEHQAVGHISGMPATIIIEKNKTVIINIDVDTGIR